MHDLPSEVLGEAVLAADGLRVGADTGGALLRVRPAQITGLLGADYGEVVAVLDAICGLRRVGGSVRLAGDEIGEDPPHDIARRGIARSFDPPRVVSELSLLDNVALGVPDVPSSLTAALTGRGRRRIADAREEASAVLVDMGLDPHASGRSLAPAERRLVCVARALVGHPRVALLEEPLGGLGPQQTGPVVARLAAAAESGTAVVVATRSLAAAPAFCAELIVLDAGATIAHGPTAVVIADPVVAALGSG